MRYSTALQAITVDFQLHSIESGYTQELMHITATLAVWNQQKWSVKMYPWIVNKTLEHFSYIMVKELSVENETEWN